LIAKPGYAFGDGTQEPMEEDVTPVRGAHGYLNSDPDMETVFIASGTHIRRGVDLGHTTNPQVAPTIAKILGVSLPAAQKRPLTDVLQQ
jgi:predicted AlkP superfamily pyrophosphatase or phosphodiesterase